MATPWIYDRHDLGILRQDGSTKVGLMLVHDKNDVPIWAEYDDEYLAKQQTQVPGYDSLPVEKELAIIGDDWRAGFGLNTFDSSDPKRYLSSYNADLRSRGMAILSYAATAATLPSIPALTDTGLETWSDASTLTNWTYSESDGGCSLAKEAATIDTGTYSARIVIPGVISAYGQILQAATNYTVLRDATLVVSVRVYNVAVGNCKGQLLITDSAGTTTANSVGSGAWETVTCARKIGSGATYVRIIFKALDTGGGTGGITYFDTGIFPTIGVYTCNAEFDDDLFISYGCFLLRVANGTGTITIQAGFHTTITDIEPFVDNNLYVCLGYSNAYWYMSNAEVFTESTAAENTIKFMRLVRTTADTMYGSDTAYTIKSTTNPANAGTAWSAATTVDRSDKDITDMLPVNNALFIMKEDRPYYLSSAGAVQVLTNMTTAVASTTGGKNSFEWEGKLYMPWGTEGLLEYDSGLFTWVSPAKFCNNLSDFDGQVQGLAGDDEWLFAGLDNGVTVEILAGRYEIIDGVTRMVWHPIVELTLGGIETMVVSSVYQKRLWLLSTTSTDSLYYIPLPQGYGDIANDANKSFQTGGYFITPWLHGEFKGDVKAWIKITLTMANTTAAIYWTVSYQKIGDGTTWTSIGDFKTSPTTTKYIPEDAATADPVSRLMRFKFVGTTTDTAVTPILYNYDIRTILYPEQRNIIYCQVKGANELLDKQGKMLDADLATIEAVLLESREATWPVTIYDINGDTKYVKFLAYSPRRVIFKTEKGRVKEWHYNLLMQEVTLS